jgi:hypothetical protein
MKKVLESLMYIEEKTGKTIIRKHMNYGEKGESNDLNVYIGANVLLN